jgi:3-oxoacyl-[acyl-carrier protein] reductase
MDLGLKNKVALVAGASAGLGFGAAKILSQEGAKVAICSRDEMRITAAANKLSTDRSQALPVVCNLSSPKEISRMIGIVTKHFGRIDILVTNCGGPPTGRHNTIGESEMELGYNLTFMSAIRLINGVVSGMKERKFGRIILSTSISAKQPIDNLLLSNAYRAGLLGYAKTISKELGPFGITVNSVLPGYTKTERLDYLAADASAKTGQTTEQAFQSWIDKIPVGRLGTPEELGSLIAFLASEQAGFITGTATAVDGGQNAGLL